MVFFSINIAAAMLEQVWKTKFPQRERKENQNYAAFQPLELEQRTEGGDLKNQEGKGSISGLCL